MNDSNHESQSPPPLDSFLEAELDRALRRYEGLLTPDMLAHFRETLGDALATHPVASRLLERARPRAAALKSEELDKAGTTPAADSQTRTVGVKR